MATKTPSVTWLPMSRTKFLIIRGPNCCDAKVRARMVMENTTPTTVMTAAAMAMSTWRAASALPDSIQNGRCTWWWYAAQSISTVTKKSRPATTTRTVGKSQNVVRRASNRQLGSRLCPLRPRPVAPGVARDWPSLKFMVVVPRSPTRLPGTP